MVTIIKGKEKKELRKEKKIKLPVDVYVCACVFDISH